MLSADGALVARSTAHQLDLQRELLKALVLLINVLGFLGARGQARHLGLQRLVQLLEGAELFDLLVDDLAEFVSLRVLDDR